MGTVDSRYLLELLLCLIHGKSVKVLMMIGRIA
jgi:hypothetical protein